MIRRTATCPDCPCFRGHALSCLPDTLSSRLLRDRVTREFDVGEVIFHEGTPSLAVYSIRSGEVKLSRRAKRGEVAVGVGVAGDLVGLRAVLAELPYGITAETLERSVVCVFPTGTFLDLVRESPAFAASLLKRLARAYVVTEEQLVARSQEMVGARTARLLLALAQRENSMQSSPRSGIRMGRTEMAVLIGTSRETLSRTLHGFARKGILRVTAGGIRIRDPRALRRQFE